MLIEFFLWEVSDTFDTLWQLDRVMDAFNRSACLGCQTSGVNRHVRCPLTFFTAWPCHLGWAGAVEVERVASVRPHFCAYSVREQS